MRLGRSIQNGVLAVAILGELIFLVGHPLFGWGPSRQSYVPTPATLTFSAPGPPAARDTLLRLAAVADRARTPIGRGRYAYVDRIVWSLADQSARDPHASRPLIRAVQSWRAPDGSGRRLTVRRTSHGVQTVTTTLAAGDRPPSLAGTPAALARRLRLGDRRREPAAEPYRAFTRVYDVEPVSASVRATMLRLLARVPGAVLSGQTTDRLGRPGIAVSLSATEGGAAIRATLVFDSRTGGLLEADEALLGAPGPGSIGHPPDVPAGALLAYTAYRRAARVQALGDRP